MYMRASLQIALQGEEPHSQKLYQKPVDSATSHLEKYFRHIINGDSNPCLSSTEGDLKRPEGLQ
jgi:hypothetical protein